MNENNSKNDPTYGIPTNEKTFLRGLDAHDHIKNEVHELCEVIIIIILFFLNTTIKIVD